MASQKTYGRRVQHEGRRAGPVSQGLRETRRKRADGCRPARRRTKRMRGHEKKKRAEKEESKNTQTETDRERDRVRRRE